MACARVGFPRTQLMELATATLTSAHRVCSQCHDTSALSGMEAVFSCAGDLSVSTCAFACTLLASCKPRTVWLVPPTVLGNLPTNAKGIPSISNAKPAQHAPHPTHPHPHGHNPDHGLDYDHSITIRASRPLISTTISTHHTSATHPVHTPVG